MKKRTIQPTFASLTERELEQLACDLQRETFAAVFARVRKPRSEGGLGLDLKSKTPLERLADKKNDLDLLNGILAARGQDKLTFAEYLSMSSGTLTALRAEPSAIHPSSGPINARVAAIHDAIITATHIRVTESDNSPHELLSLQRLADFPARVEIRQNREQLNREKFTHKIDMDNFRKHIATERLTLAQKTFHLREAITTARLQSLNPYDPDQTNQWWGEGAPEPTSTSRTDTTPTTATPADLSFSPRPLGGPQFAKRTSLTGKQICGGVGNPLGQGEGVAAKTDSADSYRNSSPFPPVQNPTAQPSANTTPSTHYHGRDVFHPRPTSTSRTDTTPTTATPAHPNPSILPLFSPFPPVQNPTTATPADQSNSPTQHSSLNTQHLASSPSPFSLFPPVQNPPVRVQYMGNTAGSEHR